MSENTVSREQSAKDMCVETLVTNRNNIKTEIAQMNVEIQKKTQCIKAIEKELFRTCKHIWKYDYSCAFDDHTKYFCETCGVWKNQYWYE